ncbi:glycosyltransferase family 4 protein [Flavobacteriaceae bacterium LMO-SS05]
MKLLYIYDKMPGVYQHYLSNVLVALKKILKIQTLAYHHQSQADFSIDSVSFATSVQSLLYRLGLSRYQRQDLDIMNRFDVIHLQHSHLKNKIKPLFYMAKKPKIVMTLRGGDTYMYPWLDANWRTFYKEQSKYIDAFVVMSDHQKTYLERWGVADKKIHVIPISFGTPIQAQPKYPNQDVLKLVSTFRMTWEKNIEGCLRFAKTLKDKNIPFTYDFYGDGKDLAQLYFLVDRFKLGDQVSIHGKLDNETLKKRLSHYDFFVQLSVSEALSASVLEAQSVGLPCVVSNSDGLPEAVLPHQSAIVNDYFKIEEMAEACIALWKDKDRYYQFSEAAMTNSQSKFSTEMEAQKLMELYQHLIDE